MDTRKWIIETVSLIKSKIGHVRIPESIRRMAKKFRFYTKRHYATRVEIEYHRTLVYSNLY